MIIKTNNRCQQCKKHSIVMFKCKCDYEYCSAHRLPEKHCCTNLSDFTNRENLEAQMVKIQTKKIETI